MNFNQTMTEIKEEKPEDDLDALLNDFSEIIDQDLNKDKNQCQGVNKVQVSILLSSKQQTYISKNKCCFESST